MSIVVEQLTRECRLAWRRIRSSPGPTVFATVTLALGIGVTVAVYSVVYTGLWRPLGVSDEAHIVLLGRTTTMLSRSAPITWDDYQGFVREQRGFSSVAAWTSFGSVLASEGTAELVQGEAVSGSYFALIGVEPALGRMLGADDDRGGAPLVAVISNTTWRTQFHSDPSIVGRTIKIADRPFEVVGVAPEGFRGLHPDGFVVRAAWVPIAALPEIDSYWSRLLAPGSRAMTFTAGARMPAGMTVAAAADTMTAAGRRLDAANPLPPIEVAGSGSQPRFRYWTARAISDDAAVNVQDALGRLIVGLPALVLLIACTNIANLVLSRGAARRHDFGVRRALGASRSRLIREQMVEQTAIVVTGGAGGVLVAYALVRGVAGLARATMSPFMRGVQFDWGLDAGVLQSAAVAVLLSIVVAGLIPALHLTRDSLRSVLDQGGTAATPRWRGRANLVALQVGVSIGLFLIAMIFVRMMVGDDALARKVAPVSPGSEHVAIATIPFNTQNRDAARASATAADVLREIHLAPSVASAAIASDQPFGPFVGVSNLLSADVSSASRSDIGTQVVAVSTEYFDAVGMPFVNGRRFSADDGHDAARVAIVNEGLALDALGTTDVVGRRVTVAMLDRAVPPPADKWSVEVTIVGVTQGVPTAAPTGRHVRRLFLPIAQQPVSDVAFIVRAAGDRPAPVDALRDAIKKVDPELAISAIGPADVLERGPFAFVGYIATILTTLAFLALGLAMAGLYGVLSHVVARRTREMGIRIAIGASATRIVRLVLRDGFRPILEGLFIGLATATVVRVFLKLSLQAKEIAPIDPIAFVLAAMLVGIAGALACYLPARRAASVDPNVALRNL